MSESKNNRVARERILEFPNAQAERKFKSALDGLPMKHSRIVELENDDEREITLELRPENLDDFRKRLQARGLDSCPTTIIIFNMLIADSAELIRLRTWTSG